MFFLTGYTPLFFKGVYLEFPLVGMYYILWESIYHVFSVERVYTTFCGRVYTIFLVRHKKEYILIAPQKKSISRKYMFIKKGMYIHQKYFISSTYTFLITVYNASMGIYIFAVKPIPFIKNTETKRNTTRIWNRVKCMHAIAMYMSPMRVCSRLWTSVRTTVVPAVFASCSRRHACAKLHAPMTDQLLDADGYI